MTSGIYILLAIILVGTPIISIFVVHLRDRSHTVNRIESFYQEIHSSSGTIITEEEEAEYRIEAASILEHAENKKYDFPQILRFREYVENLHETVIKNNTPVFDEMLSSPIEKFEHATDASVFVTKRKAMEIAEEFQKETDDCQKFNLAEYDSDVINTFKTVVGNEQKLIEEANEKYTIEELSKNKSLFDNIDGVSLDDNQRRAVVNDDDRQLVVAGAGCGKTLTMAAKVCYLCKRYNINPKEILLLSFTRKAANEMHERLLRTGVDIDAYTFHKYGLDIISKVQGKRPEVYSKINDCLKKYYKEVLSKDEKAAYDYLNLLGIMLLPNYDSSSSQGERINEDKLWDMTTLRGMYMSKELEQKRSKLNADIEELRKGARILNPFLENNQKLLTQADQDLLIKALKIAFVDDARYRKAENFILSRLRVGKNIWWDKSDKTIGGEIAEWIVRTIKEKERTLWTLRNENVKSREEVKLANILFLNGIDYEYEKEYPFDEDNNYRKKYRPDFYLPNNDIYIEHFGINEYGKAPQFSDYEERVYLNGIEWKREIHKNNNTKLLETYSWQFSKGVIGEYLDKKFDELNVIRKSVDLGEVINRIFESNEYFNSIDSLASLMTAFIALFKSNNYNLEKFDELIEMNKSEMTEHYSEKNDRLERNIAFLKVAKSFYIFYTQYLSQNNYIDFSDMINLATKYVRSNVYTPEYKYVIVDEYQDISMGRYKLIKETLEKSRAKLFCVGDDWQSIYKFTGSEVALFTEFQNYFGLYSRTDIVQTYRNSQELLDVAGEFIMKNSNQFRKRLISSKHEKKPITIIYYSILRNIVKKKESAGYSSDDENEDVTLTDALEKAISRIYAGPSTGSILVLGRNNNDINKIEFGNDVEDDYEDEDQKACFHKSMKGGRIIIEHDSYPGIEIEYMTVHKAKGIEYDNVIILNMLNRIAGFPNQMIDDPVLDLLRKDNKESYPFAEERRLFYVALTRCKHKVYILSPNVDHSRFVDEIEQSEGDIAFDGYSREEIIKCPACETGTLLVRRSAAGNDFVGCSNFPRCTFTASDVSAVSANKRCPRCGYFLVKRSGQYGKFYGCSRFPECRYTENLDGTHGIKGYHS